MSNSNASPQKGPRSSDSKRDPAAGSDAQQASAPLAVPTSTNASTAGSMPAASPNSRERHSSIVDFLSAPPPLSGSTGASTESSRRLSTSSSGNRDSDDNNSSSGSSAITTGNTKDWQDIPLTELVQKENLLSVDSDISVEQAFEVLIKNDFTSIPIKYKSDESSEENHPGSNEMVSALKRGSVDVHGVNHTFDYADLNAYLLLVLGHIEPIEQNEDILKSVLRARAGKDVPVTFVSQLGIKDPFVKMSSSSTIATAVEILGKGVHRIAITAESDSSKLVGILSQRRLVRYIWENGRLFKSLEPLFQTSLKDLDIGSSNVITIGGDQLVIEALQKMHHEGVSSLAVIDSSNILLGNISVVDVKFLTKSSESELLKYSCKQFLTVILSKRGLDNGKDSFPVFHVTLESTLGRTIAKLVATGAHRLWIVQKGSDINQTAVVPGSDGPLVGVVSLTDVLSILAKRAGKNGLDTQYARRQRRRSSSSSVRMQSDFLRRSSSELRR